MQDEEIEEIMQKGAYKKKLSFIASLFKYPARLVVLGAIIFVWIWGFNLMISVENMYSAINAGVFCLVIVICLGMIMYSIPIIVDDSDGETR